MSDDKRPPEAPRSPKKAPESNNEPNAKAKPSKTPWIAHYRYGLWDI